MSFKIHLIIVSFIIVAVYLAWQVMSKNPAPVAATPTAVSAFSISITHASWGLNCHYRPGTQQSNNDVFVSNKDAPRDQLREDNVLLKVSQLCNGKVKCDVPINVKALGDDPAPECGEKLLEVEYRCFSYDRPWTVKGAKGKLVIDCDKQ